MTLTDTTRRYGDAPPESEETQRPQFLRGHQRSPDGSKNVGQSERAASVAAGSILALLGASRGTAPGLLVAAAGGALIYRGVTGHCHAYAAMGVNTNEDADRSAAGANGRGREEEISEKGIHVEQALLINRSPADLYRYWRNFENLPAIMTHLKSVRAVDDTHSHWVATAPRLAGGKVEWDAEITHDEPDAMIGWRSLPGSTIDTVGEIRFSPAMGDRGTEVHVTMKYVPPAGRVGHWLATVFGESPRRQMRDDLRNFKRIMEVGEIPTINGQSHGTCTGRGERYTE